MNYSRRNSDSVDTEEIRKVTTMALFISDFLFFILVLLVSGILHITRIVEGRLINSMGQVFLILPAERVIVFVDTFLTPLSHF